MNQPDLDHGTVVVERLFAAPVERIFTCLADPKERAAWGAPSDTAAFIVEQDQFYEGGTDVTRCGSKADPRILVETRYLQIAPNRRIVSEESIRHDGKLLAVNLTTAELAREGAGAKLRVTIQITSFVGPEMIHNTEKGHHGSLESLASYLGLRP
jgi:uncharacterized protein YndB with AHSA1/START domain